METNCKVVHGKEQGTFMDTDCTIEFQGKKFTSGGAFIGVNKETGKMGGQVYVNEGKKTVGNWDGSIKVNCYLGKSWYSNMGDRRRSVWFRYSGKFFYGVLYSADWRELVSVREVKPWD